MSSQSQRPKKEDSETSKASLSKPFGMPRKAQPNQSANSKTTQSQHSGQDIDDDIPEQQPKEEEKEEEKEEPKPVEPAQ